jgi:enoyl-CoA hydratase
MIDVSRSGPDDAMAVILIDNPPVNALTEAVLEGLRGAARGVADDPSIRAVVLVGAGGKAFAAGADLSELAGSLGDRSRMDAHVQITASTFSALAEIAVPVIAAVDGSAVGGGLELALACDLIVASIAVKLGFPESRLGLIPGAGGTQRLPRRVGAARAFRMLALGTLIDAPEAHALGLVDMVVADDARRAAEALAAELVQQPRRAVTAAKRVLAETASLPLADGLAREREIFLELAMTADAAEGAAAFLQRRPPRFVHR